jgi:hypothetical protein
MLIEDMKTHEILAIKKKFEGNLKNNNNIVFLDTSNFESNCDE